MREAEAVRQFDAVRLRGGELVVVLQADTLSEFRTRVVAPVIPIAEVKPAATLHPQVTIEGVSYLIAIEQLATVRGKDIAEVVVSLEEHDYRIRRALDFLMVGA